MPEERADEELMISYRNGDQGSFQELYSRYEKRLHGFMMRRLSPNRKSMITDLFQITWLKVHQAKNRFNPSQKFSNWFFTIALNTLRDHLKESRHKFEVDLDEKTLAAEGDEATKNDPILREELRSLEASLASLNPSHREILLLSDWEGFPSKEIAEMVKLSDGAVRQILLRARMRLKQFMMEQTL